MGILDILGALVGIGKSAGLIKSPEDEVKLQQAALAAAAQSDTAFAQFITATSPQDVPGWANVLTALVRPFVTFLSMYLIYGSITNPALAANVKAAGVDPHWLFLPILFWFSGRSAEKITGIIQNGS